MIWQSKSAYSSILPVANTSITPVNSYYSIISDYSSLSAPPTSFVDTYLVQMCYLNYSTFNYCTTGSSGYDLEYASMNTFNSKPFLLFDKFQTLYFTAGTVNFIPVILYFFKI